MSSGTNKNEKIKILLIEDDEEDVFFLQEIFSELKNISIKFQTVDRLSRGLEWLNQHETDIVLLDLNLPDSCGITTLKKFILDKPEIPVIVLTGLGDEKDGINAVEEGAQDYFVKSQIKGNLLIRAISYAIKRKEAEVELYKLNKELKRSNQDLQDFTHSVSHDLKAPLRKIITYSEFLLEDYNEKLDKDGLEFLQRIQKSATTLRSLINDLLDLACIRTKKKELEHIDTNNLISEVLELLQFTTVNNSSLYRDDDENEVYVEKLPAIFADKTHIHQLFQNIINNGIKYKKPDEIARLNIESILKNDHIIFSIKDNGIGIEEKFLDSVFELFKRFHTNLSSPGTGIGLALCKKIVDGHGGNIWVESEINKGSTFYFTLKNR